MKASIDRIEGEMAVLILDDGTTQNRKKSTLPFGAREGDVIDLDKNEIDEIATQKLRLEIKAAREKANHGKPPKAGDFDL